MGVYSYRYPFQFDRKYASLIPGREYKAAINLCTMDCSTNIYAWSIQAVSSAPVDVKCYMANMLEVPFNEYTEHRGWVPPVVTPDVGRLWIPCTSIPDFQVSPGVNYFKQGEMADTAQFLMFHIKPQASDDDKTDTYGEAVERVAFSMVLTFR